MRKTLRLMSEEELRAKLEEADSEKFDLVSERNQTLEDLRNVENAFSDLHKKYERSKTSLENFRKNEGILKQRDDDMMEKLSNRDYRIDEMKDQLQSTIEKMHADFENKMKNLEVENAKLRVLLRKTEMKVDTLENEAGQKIKEIQKLNNLCDELVSGKINKY